MIKSIISVNDREKCQQAKKVEFLLNGRSEGQFGLGGGYQLARTPGPAFSIGLYGVKTTT